MDKGCQNVELLKFYKKSSEMSGKGRIKAKTQDLISAPQIISAPDKVKPACNLPKSKKVTEANPIPKRKKGNISKPDVQHDQFSSGGKRAEAMMR